MNPRQTILLQTDVYRLLGELFPEEHGAIVDGGANVGEAIKALRRHFPMAKIHAFEPVTEPYEQLVQAATNLDAKAYRLALGDHDTTTTINVNKNLWTCSLLNANDRGHAFHDDWCETVRTEEVRVTRLDTWAGEHDITELLILKLDLQGYELAALHGAGELLKTAKAVYSEAQISPEYEGAATFAEIDTCLRGAGFSLYQVTDLCLKGVHAEPSCCDGLWLRNDIFDRVRSMPPPEALVNARDIRAARMAEALDLCAARGYARVAVYGAGAHSVACAAAFAAAPVEITALIDDGRGGDHLWGYPITTAEQAAGMDIDAVVASSDRVESAIMERASKVFGSSTPLVTLYQGGSVRIHDAGINTDQYQLESKT